MGGKSTDGSDTRSSLIRGVRDPANDDYWQEFVAIYGQLIYRAAIQSRLSNADAEDIRQETLFAIFKKISSFEYDRNRGKFRYWILKAAHWRILDFFESNNRKLTQYVTLEELEIPDPNSKDAAAHHEEECLKKVLQRAIYRVSQSSSLEFQRFHLYHSKKMSVAEIAAKLNISPRQVHVANTRISKLIVKEARRELSQLEKGVTWQPNSPALQPQTRNS